MVLFEIPKYNLCISRDEKYLKSALITVQNVQCPYTMCFSIYHLDLALYDAKIVSLDTCNFTLTPLPIKHSSQLLMVIGIQ